MRATFSMLWARVLLGEANGGGSFCVLFYLHKDIPIDYGKGEVDTQKTINFLIRSFKLMIFRCAAGKRNLFQLMEKFSILLGKVSMSKIINIYDKQFPYFICT